MKICDQSKAFDLAFEVYPYIVEAIFLKELNLKLFAEFSEISLPGWEDILERSLSRMNNAWTLIRDLDKTHNIKFTRHEVNMIYRAIFKGTGALHKTLLQVSEEDAF